VTTYYKAVRPNGRDFYTNTVQWAPEKVKARKGRTVTHPDTGDMNDDATTYLSVSTVPTDCTGMAWPCRLLVVEAVGDVITPHADTLPNKRGAKAFRVVEERPTHEVFGPQGEHVTALIERAGTLTADEAAQLAAAWDAARAAARAAAWDAAWDAARDAAWAAAGNAVGDAAWAAAGALLARDLIGSHGYTQAHYDTLTTPWRTVIGRVHPDDVQVTA